MGNYIKTENYLGNMPNKYYVFYLKFNEKFARTQRVTWAQQKKAIFDIMSEVGENTLFADSQKSDPKYNIIKGYGENDFLLSVLFLSESEDAIIECRLLPSDENSVSGSEVNETNYQNSPFAFRFNMGLIELKDIDIFKEGKTRKLFSYIQGDHSGPISKTAFGIFISERLKRIFLIKQAKVEGNNLGLMDLYHYLEQKSGTYKSLSRSHILKFLPLMQDSEFDSEDVASVNELEIGINSDLISQYRRKMGSSDAFWNIVLEPLRDKIFGTGRDVNFSISFSEEGDEEAKQLFQEIYSSFTTAQGEEIERLFTNFKLAYESVSSTDEVTINFKRSRSYRYEPSSDLSPFNNLLNSFVWVKDQLSSTNATDEHT